MLLLYSLLLCIYIFIRVASKSIQNPRCFHPPQPLHLDCANGVGAAKLQAMAAALAHAGLHLELYNTGAGTLNHLCGSDFVQKDKALPQGFEAVGVGARCVIAVAGRQ